MFVQGKLAGRGPVGLDRLEDLYWCIGHLFLLLFVAGSRITRSATTTQRQTTRSAALLVLGVELVSRGAFDSFFLFYFVRVFLSDTARTLIASATTCDKLMT
jgi:hypothetical protein